MFQNSEEKGITFQSKLEERLVFFFVCVGIITVTYGLFVLVDFLPEKPQPHTSDTLAQEIAAPAKVTEPVEEIAKPVAPVVTTPVIIAGSVPVSIIFDTLGGKEVTVLNPASDSVQVLDDALLHGVVRHPGSADFSHTGTILLLGHSSYLPKVNNKNFQAFNGIQKLAWGDTIRLRSEDREYVYSVDRVYEAKATDASVPITRGEGKLILATCNSFGVKDDRFVVEATLVRSNPL